MLVSKFGLKSLAERYTIERYYNTPNCHKYIVLSLPVTVLMFFSIVQYNILSHIFSVFVLLQIHGDKVKLSFSMKAVNQGTGRDLDPNNVMAEYVLYFGICMCPFHAHTGVFSGLIYFWL